MEKLGDTKLDQAIKLTWGKPYISNRIKNKDGDRLIHISFPKNINKKTPEEISEGMQLLSKKYKSSVKVQFYDNKPYIQYARKENKEEQESRIKAAEKEKAQKVKRRKVLRDYNAKQKKQIQTNEKALLKGLIKKYPKFAIAQIT